MPDSLVWLPHAAVGKPDRTKSGSRGGVDVRGE